MELFKICFKYGYWSFVYLPRGLLFDRSNFPISRNRPSFARQRTDACSFSSARELSTRSTPRPSVSTSTCCSKVVSRELQMWRSVNWGNLFFKNSRFSLLPTVVNTVQPMCSAMAMEACPTPPVPAWISTEFPGRIRPRTTSA